MRNAKKIPLELEEVFIGIDVHKTNWTVSAYGAGVLLKRSVTIPGSYGQLERFLARFGIRDKSKIHVIYEAGFSGFWLAHRLRKEGFDGQVAAPTHIPVKVGDRVKTDKRDSRKLAEYFGKGLLCLVHVPDEEVLVDRELIRTREQLVDHRKSVECQIKSKLMFFGIEMVPAHKGSWSTVFVDRLKNRVRGTVLETTVNALLETRAGLAASIKQMDAQIKTLTQKARYEQSIRILETVPGIGTLTAMKILLELADNVVRFNKFGKLGAYLGLTPSEFSSGPHVRQGKITRCGNPNLRWSLVVASWLLIRKDNDLRKRYEEIKIRRGAKRAIVGIARRLAERIRVMLLRNEPYKMAA